MCVETKRVAVPRRPQWPGWTHTTFSTHRIALNHSRRIAAKRSGRVASVDAPNDQQTSFPWSVVMGSAGVAEIDPRLAPHWPRADHHDSFGGRPETPPCERSFETVCKPFAIPQSSCRRETDRLYPRHICDAWLSGAWMFAKISPEDQALREWRTLPVNSGASLLSPIASMCCAARC